MTYTRLEDLGSIAIAVAEADLKKTLSQADQAQISSKEGDIVVQPPNSPRAA